MSRSYRLFLKVEEFFGGAFEKYGQLISRHAWTTIVLAVIINIGFGFGLVKLTKETGIEQYTPTDSTAVKQREQAKSMFTINTSANFYAHSWVVLGKNAKIIVQRKDGGNMLNISLLPELAALVNYVSATNISEGETTYNFQDLCARRFSRCVTDGEYIFSRDFTTALSSKSVNYPFFNVAGQPISIDSTFGGAKASAGVLTSAMSIRFTFNLAQTNLNRASNWLDEFLKRMKTYTSNTFKFEFSHSDSLDEELSANVSGDIKYFAVTFALMITFASWVLYGGDCVSNRMYIGMVGVLSTGMAIVAALGIVSALGVKFTNLVGTMPFLIIGVGVDDMFILLSGLAETSPRDSVEIRIGKTMRSSGIAVTITSLTNLIAFCTGASSIFPAVRNFSWYTGAAILFSYLNYITFYLGCMTINEKRAAQNRHFMTFQRIKTKEQMMQERQSKLKTLCCSGSPFKHRNEVEGPFEQYPKLGLKKFVLFTPSKIVILVFFAGLIGVSIYGSINFKEGLNRKDLVATNSYFYTYYDTETKLYDQRLAISLIVQSEVDYLSRATLDTINTLRDNVRNDTDINDNLFISWLHAYMNSSYFNNSSNANFMSGLKSYLGTPGGNMYINDVTMDNDSIQYSRFHVLTENIVSSTQEANVMLRVRNIVDASTLPVFAYSPVFVFTEQYAAIYSQTLQTLGICIGVVFLITAVFLPLPIIIIFITMIVVFIMLSVIGFMYFWSLTLSSVTMIHIIMCIGFCVDFATHVCHSFVHAKGTDRNERVGVAIDRSGGPILNGALSTIVGVLMLAISKSFIFFSFFKVMFMVMVFGLMYAVLLLPVLLSFFGPNYADVSIGKNNVVDEHMALKGIHDLEDDTFKNGSSIFACPEKNSQNTNV